MTKSILAFGDNITVLTALLEQYKGKVDLVYIDPPYGTKQEFRITDERISTISRKSGGRLAYGDTLRGNDYLDFLKPRFLLLKELMSEKSSIYVHIDSKMGHYVKVLMDEIFGEKHFLNDITRIKCNPKNFSRQAFGNVKDMILFYSKGKSYIWNNPRQVIDIGEDDKRFRLVDKKGRRYTTTPLHAPGETKNGDTGKEWKGLMPPPGRHWRYSRAVLDKLDKDGLIQWSSTGNPRKIIYADEVMLAGTKMQDIWMYKDPQRPKYPTEKNMDMLKMIIAASSNEGDLVLDCFAGSGTTLVAAESLKRKFIGVDSSFEAIEVCKSRLQDFKFIDVKNIQPAHYESLGPKNATTRKRRRLP